MVINGKELKAAILTQYRSLAEFARKTNSDYSYLQATLNGLHVYKDVINTLNANGFKPVMRERKTKRKAA